MTLEMHVRRHNALHITPHMCVIDAARHSARTENGGPRGVARHTTAHGRAGSQDAAVRDAQPRRAASHIIAATGAARGAAHSHARGQHALRLTTHSQPPRATRRARHHTLARQRATCLAAHNTLACQMASCRVGHNAFATQRAACCTRHNTCAPQKAWRLSTHNSYGRPLVARHAPGVDTRCVATRNISLRGPHLARAHTSG